MRKDAALILSLTILMIRFLVSWQQCPIGFYLNVDAALRNKLPSSSTMACYPIAVEMNDELRIYRYGNSILLYNPNRNTSFLWFKNSTVDYNISSELHITTDNSFAVQIENSVDATNYTGTTVDLKLIEAYQILRFSTFDRTLTIQLTDQYTGDQLGNITFSPSGPTVYNNFSKICIDTNNECAPCPLECSTCFGPDARSQCFAPCTNAYDWSNYSCLPLPSPSESNSAAYQKTLNLSVSTLNIVATSTLITVSTLQYTSTASLLNLLFYVGVMESICNLQYLNINQSQSTLNVYSILSASFVPNWIRNLNSLDSELLTLNYGSFATSQMSMVYLDNYGDAILKYAFYIAIALLTYVGYRRITSVSIANFFKKTYVFCMSMLLVTYFGQFQSQMLYGMLQIIAVNTLIGSYVITSYVFAYVTMSLLIAIGLYTIIRLRSQYQKIKDNSNDNSIVSIKNPSSLVDQIFKILYAEYRSDNEIQFLFSVVIGIFNFGNVLIILAFQTVPILQVVIQLVLILSLIIFTYLVKPFANAICRVTFFINYSTLLIINIVNVICASMELLSRLNEKAPNETIASIINYAIIANISLNILVSIGSSSFKLAIYIMSKYRKRRLQIVTEIQQQQQQISQNDSSIDNLHNVSRF